MNASFGIDHPLLATHDISGLRDRLIALGFNMTAIGKHPWGTSTSLAMFNGCLLEIMGIYDEGLIDEVPAGDFRFGRHVYEHLQEREGVALTALHSTDSVRDADQAKAAGFHVAGHLEFGRDVVLPDGRADRTKTTLALLPDPDFPRLSFFLCQQHRPELIYVTEWLKHPNSVNGIGGITIAADEDRHGELRQKLSSLYGEAETVDGGFRLKTANGAMNILTPKAIEEEFGELPIMDGALADPCIVAMDLTYERQDDLDHWIGKSGDVCRTTNSGHLVTDPEKTATVFLRFVSA